VFKGKSQAAFLLNRGFHN